MEPTYKADLAERLQAQSDKLFNLAQLDGDISLAADQAREIAGLLLVSASILRGRL